jgi:DNA repair exonuclease SbcCD ATPase subunit
MELAEQETVTAEPDTAALADTAAPVIGETQAADDVTQQADASEQDGELVVSIGEDAPPQLEEDGPVIRRLRKIDREKDREIKELKRKLEAITAPEQKQDALPPKPTLQDFDYDEEAKDKALEAWLELKRKADEAKDAEQKQQEAAQAAWDAKLATYQKRKQSLARDADDAEAALLDALSAKWGHQQAQQRLAMLVEAADDPAQLVYALGKIPGRAKELAEIESVVRFVAVASKMESQVKLTKRQPAAAPEKPMTGTAPVGVGGTDATLDRLYAEAARTGNMTKVIAYKRQLKRA